MASIRASPTKISVCCADSFIIFDLRDGDQDLNVVKVPQIVEVQNEGETKTENSNTIKDDNRILASVFSKSGKYFVLADDRKYLHLYLSEECRLLWSRSVVRRCTNLIFSQDEKYVVISDKSGDVYRYLIDQPKAEQRKTEQKQDEQNQKNQDNQKQCGELLLGHLSMVLDLVLMKNDQYLVTCDKDEKIRISCYPNSYNIHSFCLGHTQFVNSLIYEEEKELLISGSGDCTIRIWDYHGKQQYCQQCQCQITDTSDTAKDTPYIKCMSYSPNHKLLAVGFGDNKSIEIYRLQTEDREASLELVQCIDVERDILDLVTTDDKLYILQPIQDNFIQVYDINSHTTGQQQLTLCTDEKTKQFLNKLKLLKDFFSGCLNIECNFPNLRKSRTDNMAEYLQRKEKRILGEKLEPPTYNEKKLKLS